MNLVLLIGETEAGISGCNVPLLALLRPYLDDALSGMSLYIVCAAVLARCGYLVLSELAVRLRVHRAVMRTGLLVSLVLAVVLSPWFTPSTKPATWPVGHNWLHERRVAIQKLGHEVLSQVNSADNMLPPIPAPIPEMSGASWRVPARRSYSYVYRPPLAPLPVNEFGDWIILHEPSMNGALQLAFTGSGSVLEMGRLELFERLSYQHKRMIQELNRISQEALTIAPGERASGG